MEFLHKMKQSIPTAIRLLAARVLPYRDRLSSPNISKANTIAVSDSVLLHVYWLALPDAAGPAASLMMDGDELMRFDCLGPGMGHMHINMKQTRGFPGDTPRLYFCEQPVSQQVDRSCFELEHNLDFAMKTNFSRRIRKKKLDAEQINRASAAMREAMTRLLAEHRSINSG